jgi:fermentation-respiration switch protein FrsA (DUF1100 family)
MKTLKTLLLPLILLAATGCSHVFYQPTKERITEPKRIGIEYEDVFFKTKDGVKLHGWFFSAGGADPEKAKGTFIQFHGNAENLTTHFVSLVWVIKHGYNLLAFDYRGYWDSEGKPTQEGLNADALAAIEYVQGRIPKKAKPDIILFGQSLGGAVMMRALHDIKDRTRFKLVVADSTFYSYQHQARWVLSRHWLTWIMQPLAWVLVSDGYSPEEYISEISPVPFLVIHGDHDQAVPFEGGEKIFSMAKEPKWFWHLENGTHIDGMFRERGKNRERLLKLIESLPN